jgi:hypothetical protein
VPARRRDGRTPGPEDRSARREREFRRQDRRQAARDHALVPGLYLG